MPSGPLRGLRFVGVFVGACLAALALSGCAGVTSSTSPTPTPTPPTVTVALSITEANVQVGGTQALTATVANDSQSKGVTWKVSGTGCSGATCGTLSTTSSASGVGVTYTAPAAAPTPATVTVTATSVADGTKSAAATITVTTSPVIVVSVSPATASVPVGGTQTFTATVQNDPQNKGVTWVLSGVGCTSNNNLCGRISAIFSASGQTITYTAPTSAPSPMAVTLTATSVADISKSEEANITVSTTPVLVVTVSPPAPNVPINTTQQFIATVQNDPQNKGVTWALLGSACQDTGCGGLSTNASGSGIAITYTAPAFVPTPAAVTLRATSVADGTKSAAAIITITTSPAISVTVSPTTASVSTNGIQAFTATVANDSQNKGVIWALLGASCSEGSCGTLSANASASGVAITYAAPATVPMPATVSLTATSVTDNTKTATAMITVTLPGAVNVTLTPKRGGIPVSQTLNFTATVANDAGNKGVTWSATGNNCSGNACGTFTVGTPSTTAMYNAPSSAGVYTIVATSAADNTQSAAATIGVSDLPGVLTYHNDVSRDGVNAQEYALTTTTVAGGTFGKLFSCAVDGAVYAQPLWVPGLTVNGAMHNVIFVATQHDSLYAFDADANPCVRLWHVSLIDTGHGGTAGETPVPTGTNVFLIGQGAGDITPEVGVTGTPVIDASTNTLYVVSKSVVVSGPTFFQRLHAIDLASGNEKFAGPVGISASVSGNAPDAVGGQVTFSVQTQNQRPSLALVNGVVYIGWASHEDQDPWHGWLMGYTVTNGTLAQVPGAAFNTTPNTVGDPPATYARGGIWMAGGAPAADSNNNLFLITGNGTFDGVTNFGDSLLKLSTSSGLSLTDWFTPSDEANLDANDLDFGAGGAVVLVDMPLSPVPHLLLGGGKQGSGNPGEIFVLNRDALGNMNGTDSQVVQKFSTNNQIFSTPAFWNNTLYVASLGGNLMSYPFNSSSGLFGTSPQSTVAATPSSQSTAPSAGFAFPGATPSVSATAAGTNGIVWALDNSLYCTPQSPGCGPAVLHAYDAANLSTELWNSGGTAGNAVKFTVPTVANGKVYVGTRGSDIASGGVGELDVYGLLPN